MITLILVGALLILLAIIGFYKAADYSKRKELWKKNITSDISLLILILGVSFLAAAVNYL